jgi:NAD(P)-dependent dehydrogenase (short-subunit alcohol dehydrogenase family)
VGQEPVGGGVVVTGASSGIGAAVAAELAGRGLEVACISRRGTVPLDEADPRWSRLTCYAADVCGPARITEVLHSFAARAGGIHGLVNSAGQHIEATSADLLPGGLRELLEVNLIALVECSRQVFPYLRENGGTIINIGSVFAKLGVPRNLAYSASKAAVASVTRTLAVEWAAERIRVLTVAPGYIRTDMTTAAVADDHMLATLERRVPLRRLGTAAEVARLVAALFTEQVGFLSGETIYVDGGQGIRA